MKHQITVNGKALSEYVKEKEVVEEENKIVSHNIELNNAYSLYQKPHNSFSSKKEKNGKVKKVQNEINYRNRDEAVKAELAKNNLLEAFVYYLIGSYKEKEIRTDALAHHFMKVKEENNLERCTLKSHYYMRMIFSQIKKSTFFENYIIFKTSIKDGNSYTLTDEGYNLTFEQAMKAVKIISDSAIKSNKESKVEKKSLEACPEKIDETNTHPVGIKGNNEDIKQHILSKLGLDNQTKTGGVTINIFGPINIQL